MNMAENGICVREDKVKILSLDARGKTQRKKTVITINQLYNSDWFRPESCDSSWSSDVQPLNFSELWKEAQKLFTETLLLCRMKSSNQ